MVLLAATNKPLDKSPYGLTKGTPAIRSVSALTFGKDGILFIGDSKSATVFALDTKDVKAKAASEDVTVNNIDQKIASALGTEKGNITIMDMAVNPVSKKIYIAVQYTDGTPALLRMEDGQLSAVPVKDVNFSSILINDVNAEDAKDARGRSLRISTISDIGFDNGKLYLSGLSNKEFSSTFRSIPFPFTQVQDQASLEIYHGAHGRYETTSPIRTFTTAKIKGKDYLIASYTCTPLVLFPVSELKAGSHVKGRTVAEMGSGNTPIDMTTLQKNGESLLLMANSSKPVSEVNYKSIEAFEGTLTEKVSGTAGTDFKVLSSYTGVVQMDKLDNDKLVMIQKKPTGEIDLLTVHGNTL
jgi:hypothetical protein